MLRTRALASTTLALAGAVFFSAVTLPAQIAPPAAATATMMPVEARNVSTFSPIDNLCPSARSWWPAISVRIRAGTAMIDSGMPSPGVPRLTPRHTATSVVTNSSVSIEN